MGTVYRFTCIVCPIGCFIEAELNDGVKIRGCRCSRGEKWVKEEILDPKRVVISVIKVKNGKYPIVSVKTDKPVKKELVGEVMKILANVEIDAPVRCGDILVRDILNTGANIVATRDVMKDK